MGEESVDRSEGFGERLLGLLLDRARLMPPQLSCSEFGGVPDARVTILAKENHQHYASTP